jgi:hypothetical protein
MSDWIEKVHAHADGELSADEKAEVDALLASDARAAAEHQWAVYLKHTLRTKRVEHDYTHAWKRCLERLDAIDALQASPKVEAFVGRWSWGFAAALFAVILFAGLLGRGPDRISDRELAGLFMGNPLTSEQDVDSADDADALARRDVGLALPQIEPVVKVTKFGKGTLDGRTFVLLGLEDNTGPLKLFAFQGTDEIEGLEPISGRREFFGGTVNAHSCVGWTADGVTYLVVGDRTSDELVLIADRMRR